MSHPVLWPKAFFYPVGNSSAICLTDNLPPENPANVLLLGCGDPRHILYTLHVDPPIQRPVFDVTCCDIEPAVIARNVLLFTLIYDGHQNERIWDIFYNIKVDQTSFELLISQTKKLLDITRDLGSWRKSPYSRFLRFGSRYTVSQLRRYLRLYARTEDYSQKKHKELFSSFTREFEARHHTQIVPDTAHSAGPFAMDARCVLSEHFFHYWQKGTVSRSATRIAAAMFVNPTFVYSESSTPSLAGYCCTLHYGTYPLQGFHLAAAFLSPSTEKTTEERLISCAKLQFQEWCSTFKAISSSQKTVTIRLFIGDALSFCQRLDHLQSAPADPDNHLYVSPWTTAELVLDGGDYHSIPGAPTNFDVVDTSNLTDHVGLLNILVAAVPLLTPAPTSVLYTEAVLDKETAGTEGSNLLELLFADIPTIGLLLGVSPTGYISQFNSTPKAGLHEIAEKFRERIGWKFPYPIGSQVPREEIMTPSFPNPSALADVLFRLYERIFADEDIRQIVNGSRIAQNLVHYHRGSFAALLGLVKSRIQTDWSMVMEKLFDRLCSDRNIILGSSNFQELCCQLYLRGVYCPEFLGPRRAVINRSGLFKGWKEIPALVCVVLVIPRERIQRLERMSSQGLGSPMFECGLRGQTFQCIFACIQAVLGTVSFQGSGSDGRVSIAEDAAGWSGISPLVVSVLVPASNLVLEPQCTQVTLGLHTTPTTAVTWSGILGPMLTLFTADVTDTSAVYVTMNRPDCSPSALASVPVTFNISRTQVSVAIAECRISTMTTRWEMSASERRNVKEAKVDYKQNSPCVIQVVMNDVVRKEMVFPFPIDGTRAKVRIARKSGWIEVEAPARYGLDSSSEFPSLKITSVLAQGRRPVVWNIPRVNLASLPIMEAKLLDRHNLTLTVHCDLSFSDREQSLRKNSSQYLIVQIKETIMALFAGIIQQKGPNVIRLSNPDDGGIYTIIFCNGIRMDLSSHTFIVDACVLPLTEDLMEGRRGLNIVGLSSQGMTINTRGDEADAWKYLFVGFTERCRTWKHTANCKYVNSNQVPASVKYAQNPLCGCGEGIDLGALSLDPRWKDLAPLMTRVAISPLFGIAYLETVDQRVSDMLEDKTAMSSLSNGSKKNCAVCHKTESAEAKLLKCSRCKEVDYCGKECQMGHWKEHKKVCKAK
ncbi:hypothetical protein DFH07DRAFT_889361 [Mycena maculata]|uniref:MYND-type domain-containing protein n=1 Tax=Mycena maculata TaxID=230809 RepID=A0AAD7IQQ2_9AGAR|nr:hypothetical protein DFH07DRAFT_889361 [Mycena maculata]